MDETAVDFDCLAHALSDFIAAQGLPGVLPSQTMLRAAGRDDLLAGIERHGGRPAVAERLGLRLAAPRKPYGYWQRPGVLERELADFIAAHGQTGRFPSHAELTAAGRIDLALAISRSEGVAALATRLGLKTARHERGYWEVPENLAREIRAFAAELGRPDMIPKYQEMVAAGRSDLTYAVDCNGGMAAVAERVGLRWHRQGEG